MLKEFVIEKLINSHVEEVGFDTAMEAGICRECGHIVESGIEPDADGYKCPECFALAVQGMRTAAIEVLCVS